MLSFLKRVKKVKNNKKNNNNNKKPSSNWEAHPGLLDCFWKSSAHGLLNKVSQRNRRGRVATTKRITKKKKQKQ